MPNAKNQALDLSTVDWKRVFEETRPYTRIAGYFHLAVGIFFGVVALLVGAAVYFLMKDGAIPAAILGGAGLIEAGLSGWKGGRDLKGSPLVVTARVKQKSLGRSSRSRQFYLDLDVSDAFRVASTGFRTPEPTLVGDLKLKCGGRLYHAISENESTVIVCTPTNEAVVRLHDLGNQPESDLFPM